MSKVPRFISRQLARIYSERNLFRINSPVFLPFYHVVSNQVLPHILNYPFRNIDAFEKELDFMLSHFKPVSLSELIHIDKTDEKIFHISFDDGLKECAEIIAPLLIKKGVPATFFINSGFVDNKDLFHRYKASLILSGLRKNENKNALKLLKEHNLNGSGILQTGIEQKEILNTAAKMLGIDFQEFLSIQKPYLSTKQILSLKEQGFSIGAHSVNHAEFYKLSEDEQFGEIKRSIDWLLEKINPSVKSFSFPFTDNGVSRNLITRLRKENICDITFGTAGLKYDECDSHFQRFPVEQKGDFILNLKTEWIYFIIRDKLGKSIVKH